MNDCKLKRNACGVQTMDANAQCCKVTAFLWSRLCQLSLGLLLGSLAFARLLGCVFPRGKSSPVRL